MKDTFADKTFRPRTFAAVTFQGGGAPSPPLPAVPLTDKYAPGAGFKGQYGG